MRTALIKLSIVLVLLVGAYGAGRFLSPTKTVTRTEYKDRIVEKEVIKWRIRKAQHEYKTVVEHKFSDGTLITKSTDDVNTNTTTDKAKADDKTKTTDSSGQTSVLFNKPNWRVSLLADTDFSHGPEYGLQVDRRLFGPIWFGATTHPFQHRIGASLGLEF